MAVSEVDELIHAPARLKIMSMLVELGPKTDITFARLQALLEMTPGNLSAHMKRLEAANYLTVSKDFTSRGVAQTHIRVTSLGIAAFENYVAQLRGIIGATLEGN